MGDIGNGNVGKRVRNSGHSGDYFLASDYVRSIMAEYRRRLPHFHPEGEYLFVTWRLHGSLPAAPPDMIYPTPGHAFAARDRALARGCGRLWLSDVRVARIVVEAIRAGESRKFYELSAWVVMPNHVHLLILPQVALPQITQWIKGRTAREANVLLGRVGQRSGSMNPTITGSGMRRSCSGSRRMSKRIRSRLGWPLLLRIGLFQAPRRQAKACPTNASHPCRDTPPTEITWSCRPRPVHRPATAIREASPGALQ
jgi:hypothetical protein